MAASDKIPPVRREAKFGDIETNRPVSEGTLKDFAAQSNFINDFQTDIKEFKLNGAYSVASGITFLDGIASFFYNSEIVGITFYNGRGGTSGVTEFDLRWKDSDGVDQGSIFSVTPKINSTAADEVFMQQNLTTGNNKPAVTPTGITLGEFSKTEFLEGEAVYMVLNSSMSQAQNAGIFIFYKPIN
jgi:hypothetical protein